MSKTSEYVTLGHPDKHGNVYETWEEYKDILPQDLIEKYKLRKPIYAEMCEKGLFYFIQ